MALLDFSGAPAIITAYDPNFTTINSVGVASGTDGAGLYVMNGTDDLWIGYYNTIIDVHQRSTISAKIYEDSSTIRYVSPTVRATINSVGYHLQYTTDGTTVSGFKLRRGTGTSASTWIANLTTITAVAAASFIDYKIEAETIDASTVRVTVTVNGVAESFDDASVDRLLTGFPGLINESDAANTNQITSFQYDDLSVSGANTQIGDTQIDIAILVGQGTAP